MSIAAEFYANVRSTATEAYGSGQFIVDQNPRGDLCVAPSLLSKTELARLANSWSCQIATGSAYTNVANMPTTRGEIAFYNGYTDTTCMVIDQVWMLSLTSITAISAVTLIYQVGAVAALTNDTAQLINSPLGKTYSGSITRAVAVTTMTANKWAAIGCAGAQAATSIGSGCFAEVNGGIIVKPGFTVAFNAVVGTATGTSLIGCSWHEIKLPLV